MMKKVLFGIGLLLVLSACKGKADPLPTNAPFIPPTPTSTLIPSSTPLRQAATPNPLTPTPDLRQPSWTPRATDTPLPSRTPPPSSTPLPTDIPAQALSSGLEVLPDGSLYLVVGVEELNLRMADAPFKPKWDIELDGIRIDLSIHNDFLDQDSMVRASVTATVSAEGLNLRLDDFTSEGPMVTRTQVRDALAQINPFLNEELSRRMEQEVSFTRFELAAGFLIVEARVR